MKREFVHFTIAAAALVFGGAAEEMLPRLFGAGVPLLFAFAVYFALRRTRGYALAFAVAAGAAEDALSSLPFATSVGFFVPAAAAFGVFRLPMSAIAVFYPFYQVWLWLWTGVADGGDWWARAVAAVPLALAAMALAAGAVRWAERKGGLDAV